MCDVYASDTTAHPGLILVQQYVLALRLPCALRLLIRLLGICRRFQKALATHQTVYYRKLYYNSSKSNNSSSCDDNTGTSFNTEQASFMGKPNHRHHLQLSSSSSNRHPVINDWTSREI